jgi:hypothetical protein
LELIERAGASAPRKKNIMAQLTAQLRIVLINNLKRVHDIPTLMELDAEIHELMVEKQLEIEREEMHTKV